MFVELLTGKEDKMSSRRTKIEGNPENKHELSRGMRKKRLALFIQQFEKEAQERMNYLESKMENLLATVDKVFKVELMKLPPALQNTLIGDLISEETSASEVSIAMKSESREMAQPLRRIPSRRLKPLLSTPGQRSSALNPKTGKGTKGTGTPARSNSTGNFMGSSVTGKRTQGHSASRKTTEQPAQSQKNPKLRTVLSAGDLYCSTGGSAAHITVTTAQGQMLSVSEETKDEINLELLDDVAWCQIQKLTGLIEYLSQRSRLQR